MDEEGFDAAVTAARAGAAWAMTVIYRELQPSVLRYCRARLGRDGEDVAGEVWLQVARDLGRFSGDADGFRGWVFTIARRRVVDEQRRRRRRPTQGEGDVEAAVGAIGSAEEVAFDGRLGDEAAHRIVASLPPEQAEVILLRVVAGLSAEEVAEIVGRTVGHVRVIQHRALRRLAKESSHDV